MPHPQWVVQSLSTSDLLSNTTSPTTYFYKNPKFSIDDENKWGFRGFEEVQTTRPSTAVAIERYSYSPDWSGRLVNDARPKLIATPIPATTAS